MALIPLPPTVPASSLAIGSYGPPTSYMYCIFHYICRGVMGSRFSCMSITLFCVPALRTQRVVFGIHTIAGRQGEQQEYHVCGHHIRLYPFSSSAHRLGTSARHTHSDPIFSFSFAYRFERFSIEVIDSKKHGAGTYYARIASSVRMYASALILTCGITWRVKTRM